MPSTPTGPGSTTVAVEASALRAGTHEASSFVTSILGALGEEGSVTASVWSLRRLGRRARGGHDVSRRFASPVAGRAAAIGASVPARWAAPNADVLHLASGPKPVRVVAPAVISVHGWGAGFDDAADGPSARRARELLRRAAGEGVVIHAVTDDVADALVDELRVARSSVIVVHPGIALTESPAARTLEASAPPSVDVVEGRNGALDTAVCDAINGSHDAVARIVGANEPLRGACAVVASPSSGFPTRTLEALAGGIPVVTARTATTASLLTGAVRLVEHGAVADYVEAALDLATSASERSIAIAAGRARASDFDWRRRIVDLVELYQVASHAA